MTKATRPGPRGDLSSAAVVAAGRQLALQGDEPVTLRAVARELGARPNALYTYVRSTAHLRHLVGDSLLAELDLSGLHDRDRCPACRVTDTFNRVETLFLAHPGAAALFASGRVIGEASLDLNEGLLDCLADAGLDAADSARIVGLLTALLHGTALLAPTDELTDDDREHLRSFDPARYPRTASMPATEGMLAADMTMVLAAFGVPECPTQA